MYGSNERIVQRQRFGPKEPSTMHSYWSACTIWDCSKGNPTPQSKDWRKFCMLATLILADKVAGSLKSRLKCHKHDSNNKPTLLCALSKVIRYKPRVHLCLHLELSINCTIMTGFLDDELILHMFCNIFLDTCIQDAISCWQIPSMFINSSLLISHAVSNHSGQAWCTIYSSLLPVSPAVPSHSGRAWCTGGSRTVPLFGNDLGLPHNLGTSLQHCCSKC
jgi:hypothetical protein